jgi:ribonuclease HIII
MSSCFVAQIDVALAATLRQGLQEQGFTLSQPPYTLLQGKKAGITCTLYTSGKLLVQGKGKEEFIRYFLEPHILHTFTYGYEHVECDLSPHIGVDESGKGDFFGPLCIAGLYAEGEGISKLVQMGVRDSKRVGDASSIKIAQKIRKDYLCHIVRIGPEKYNALYEKFGNLNLLLGWGHATVIEQLVIQSGCEKVIIDQFADEHVVIQALKKKNQKVLLIQRTKAEADVVVAGASILARAAFLEGLAQCEEISGIPLPKGSSGKTIEAGRELVKKQGASALFRFAKRHFKLSDKILDPFT